MAKRTNDKKIKINPEQKAMLSAVQAQPVEKVDETVAANENEPEPKVEGDAGNAQAELPAAKKDTRTKEQKRADRKALRDKALQEALEQNLPFFEKYPAIEFEKNYAKAFKDATTCEGAIPADTIRASQAKIAESIAKSKTSTQELVEAAKAAVTPTAEMDNTETIPDNTPVAVIADGKEFVISAGGDLVSERDIGETTTVMLEGIEYVLDAKGDLVRNDGESSKKFGARKHQYKGALYRSRKAEKAAAAETESRNGEPPTPSEINKNLPMDETEGEVVTTSPAKDAKDSANVFEAAAMQDDVKVCDDLVKESEEADAKKNTQAEPATPDAVEEPVQPTTTEETETVEPASEDKVAEPVATVSVENAPAPVTKPTMVVDNTKKASQPTTRGAAVTENAAKFYGSAWSAERASKLSEAYYWLMKAIDFETQFKKPDGTEPFQTKKALEQAIKYENEAFALGMAKAA